MNPSGGIEYTTVRELRGPLAIVGGVSGIGWDEDVRITLASGEVRHGVVLDADRDLAVVQVLEGTSGLRALRRPWNPRLREDLHRAGLALEQSEHEDGVRRRRVSGADGR
ncbi:hypothetical protein ACIRVN_02975 [Streptomyces albogriseolus]|uniref:hypothetical protein n=1 Tax=Streptomyces albogriseolus TaxID=1887 RepID=UPI003805FE86